MTLRAVLLRALLLAALLAGGGGSAPPLQRAGPAPPLPSPRPRVHLATYAACASAARLPAFAAEARATGFFDAVTALHPEDLDASFTAQHASLLDAEQPTRGCGYWLWKPQAALQVLRAMRPGDVMVYADAGASLHAENCARFWEYVSLAAANPTKVLSFEMAHARAPADASWAKADAAAAMGLAVNGSEMRSPQLHATYFFMARSPQNVALLAEWRDLAGAQGYHLLDDSASRLPNGDGFIEHRHDQALFSLLRKKRGAALVVPDDAQEGGAPIQATRCRTGREAACALRRLKEALWVWARDELPGLEDTWHRDARRDCAARRPGAGGGAPWKHVRVPRLGAMTAAARGFLR